jgi:hypothetical protein
MRLTKSPGAILNIAFFAMTRRVEDRSPEYKIAGSDFEHRVFCDGPQGKVQEVFCNAIPEGERLVTVSTGSVTNKIVFNISEKWPSG